MSEPGKEKERAERPPGAQNFPAPGSRAVRSSSQGPLDLHRPPPSTRFCFRSIKTFRNEANFAEKAERARPAGGLRGGGLFCSNRRRIPWRIYLDPSCTPPKAIPTTYERPQLLLRVLTQIMLRGGEMVPIRRTAALEVRLGKGTGARSTIHRCFSTRTRRLNNQLDR